MPESDSNLSATQLRTKIREFHKNTKTCERCLVNQFTIFNRPHHCRMCGYCVCNDCSKHKFSVNSQEVRVCDVCISSQSTDSLNKAVLERTDERSNQDSIEETDISSSIGKKASDNSSIDNDEGTSSLGASSEPTTCAKASQPPITEPFFLNIDLLNKDAVVTLQGMHFMQPLSHLSIIFLIVTSVFRQRKKEPELDLLAKSCHMQQRNLFQVS